ncbi:PhoH family protein [Fodinibius sediminis]|uniref:PhoH-like ATPase n=1 Tax=Fodinibius sediminis TaxID=1214077 RepID=A0A521D4A5_9BACT|nr:PhoH family protein [Fodinibius sediminis]SMO66495.1 PhoH-like ATPase [Fodinibius sediminis]
MAAAKKHKIYVLDTSVILYDCDAIKNFKKNDVAIPITVLEEIDSFKKGNDVINLHAREFSRYLDKISDKNLLQTWIPLDGETHGKLRVLNNENSKIDAAEVFGREKNDHRILNAVLKLMEEEPDKKVILVSKDINLRIKARALSIDAEDYETIRIKDIEHLYRGKTELNFEDSAIIDRFYEEGELKPESIGIEEAASNHFYILKSPVNSALGYYDAHQGRILPVQKKTAYGIKPRNAEQTFALQAIMNPDNLLVTITGSAGTGKTLLALAGALEQRRHYQQIYLARPIVPLSNKDLGYLPGDITSKINPYMQPLWDNLSFIKNQFPSGSKQYKKVDEMIENEKLHIVPLAYIRGRSLSNVIFIIDEAQNLTPHEVKTIITRAGDDTKIIFTGDIYQIDTPYLDTQSNGLSFLVDRMHDNDLYAHINLEKGERSELANLASKLL